MEARWSLLRAFLFAAFFSLVTLPQAFAQETSPLTIQEPSEGEQVETPFNVSGIAPAGAQLELWLGSALERVFRADSDGGFSTAVSTAVAPDTKIWVHQVSRQGKRLRSAYVVVNWSGEAAPRPPELEASEDPGVAEPENETGPETGTEPVADSAEGRPSDPRPLGDGGLPSVESVDAIDAVPEPPPVADAAGVDPFETADEVDPFDVGSTVTTSNGDVEGTPPDRPPGRFVRGLAETGVGLAGGATGAFVGGLVGAGVGFALAGDGFAAAILASIGALSGWVAGIPVGVVIAGRAMQGNGKVWAVILGEVVGFMAAGALTEVYYGSGAFNDIPPALMVGLLPPIGAAIGYELTSDASRFQTSKGLQSLRPTLRPAVEGRGATIGFQARF